MKKLSEMTEQEYKEAVSNIPEEELKAILDKYNNSNNKVDAMLTLVHDFMVALREHN